MATLEVRHKTLYRYRQPVAFSEHRAMMRPRDSHDLRLLETSLTVSPVPSRTFWMHDVFNNSITVLNFDTPADELMIESWMRLEHFGTDRLEVLIDPLAEVFPFAYSEDQRIDLGATLDPHYPDPDGSLEAWARAFLPGDGKVGTMELLGTMCRQIKDDFAYEVRNEHGTRPPAKTLELMSGSCRDFALLMMEALRRLGFATRFVSGYLYDPAVDGGEAATGAGATHAWAQVFLPSVGWLEVDPTNGRVGGGNLIRVATARDPKQAIPFQGSFIGAPDAFLGLEIEVEVRAVPQPEGSAQV